MRGFASSWTRSGPHKPGTSCQQTVTQFARSQLMCCTSANMWKKLQYYRILEFAACGNTDLFKNEQPRYVRGGGPISSVGFRTTPSATSLDSSPLLFAEASESSAAFDTSLESLISPRTPGAELSWEASNGLWGSVVGRWWCTRTRTETPPNDNSCTVSSPEKIQHDNKVTSGCSMRFADKNVTRERTTSDFVNTNHSTTQLLTTLPQKYDWHIV
jgi:hypothetical protein